MGDGETEAKTLHDGSESEDTYHSLTTDTELESESDDGEVILTYKRKSQLERYRVVPRSPPLQMISLANTETSSISDEGDVTVIDHDKDSNPSQQL